MNSGREDRWPVSEAEVQFELYRLLTNLISAQAFEIEFVRVQPERVTKEGKAADLVLLVKRNGAEVPEVVFEIKKPTDRSVLVFDEEAVQQAQGYVKSLDASLSVVMDGRYLRAFSKSGTSLGVYRFDVNPDSIRKLLVGIASLLSGKASTLPLEAAQQPNEQAAADELAVIQPAFIKSFDKASKVPGYSQSRHDNGRIIDLAVAGHRIMALQLNQDPSKVTLVIWLEGLREALGPSFGQFMQRLSGSQGFAWLKSRELDGPYSARGLRAVAAEADLDSILAELRAWLVDVGQHTAK